MFSVHCESHGSEVLLTVRNIEAIVNHEQGMVVRRRCPCGQRGAFRTGVARTGVRGPAWPPDGRPAGAGRALSPRHRRPGRPRRHLRRRARRRAARRRVDGPPGRPPPGRCRDHVDHPSAEPKPTSSAMRSTGLPVVSSRRCAGGRRWRTTHWWGVVPATSWKRRANVRGLIAALAARRSTASGWASWVTAQSMTSAIGSSDGPRARTGACTNCAWPPARWGGTTILRATALATAAPWSRRTRCRHRSIPAAVPADVITVPSTT